MKLYDNSGGFWTDIVIKRNNPQNTIKNYFLPDENSARIIGQEMISSIKGGARNQILFKRRGGKVIALSKPSGSYSFGILKRISPNGVPYEQLSHMTLWLRKNQKGINRSEAFILRETSRHILDGIRILSIKNHPRSGGFTVTVGWSGENENIAEKQNSGFTAENPLNEYGIVSAKLSDVEIPARPFIGFQDEFREVLEKMMNSLTRIYG
jgi:hypothetical protein